MKKIISIVLIILVCCSLVLPVLAKDNDITFSFAADSVKKVNVGDTFSLKVQVDDTCDGFAAGSFVVGFSDELELVKSEFLQESLGFDGDFEKAISGELKGSYICVFLSIKDYKCKTGDFCSLTFRVKDAPSDRLFVNFFGNDICNSDFEAVTTNKVSHLIDVAQSDESDVPAVHENGNDNTEQTADAPGNTAGTPTQEKIEYSDVPATHWAYEYVNLLSAKGIVGGVGNNMFAPDRSVTRAEFVKMLAGLVGMNVEKYYTDRFSDVGEKDWFMPYVAWAVDNEITTGTSETTFSPKNPITREQAATLIYRLADKYSLTLDEINEAYDFADSAEISSYASEAVTAMQKAGILQGVGGGRFNPKGSTTRAAAAKMIAMLIKK